MDFWKKNIKKPATRVEVSEFEDEELLYNSFYVPERISLQVCRINELFPRIGFAAEHLASTLPDYAEGWSAIPRWELIAPSYGKAVEKVVERLYWQRNGRYCDEHFDFQRLRQTERSAKAFAHLEQQQPRGGILVVPTQFGWRHAGRSARRTEAVLVENEFCLGVFATCMMLLLHPERLKGEDDLRLFCSGDEYDVPSSENRFGSVPVFGFDDDDGVYIHWSGVHSASIDYGTATGFLL